jgi:hypothetical protein
MKEDWVPVLCLCFECRTLDEELWVIMCLCVCVLCVFCVCAFARVIAWGCDTELQNWHKLEVLSFLWKHGPR